MQIQAHGPTESDRMTTRLLIALHAEKELDSLDVEGVLELLRRLDQENGKIKRFGLPSKREKFQKTLDRLESHDFVSVSKGNPHIRVSFPGFLSCGILNMPSDLSAAFQENLSEVDLE